MDRTNQTLMGVWLGLLGIVIAMWLLQRWLLHGLLRQWNAGLADAKDTWDRELWNTSDAYVEGERAKRRLLLDLQKEAYLGLTKPLEPYIAVFVLFSTPAIVMATDACSAETADVGGARNGDDAGCQTYCFMLLAARPIATAAVYFADRECRAQLWSTRTLFRKLWTRIWNSPLFFCTARTKGAGVGFDPELERVKIIENGSTDAEDGGLEVVGEKVPYELMDDADA